MDVSPKHHMQDSAFPLKRKLLGHEVHDATILDLILITAAVCIVGFLIGYRWL
jgi:hypothetical protein